MARSESDRSGGKGARQATEATHRGKSGRDSPGRARETDSRKPARQRKSPSPSPSKSEPPSLSPSPSPARSRSHSTTPSPSSRRPSRSPSPRTKRLRRAQEERRANNGRDQSLSPSTSPSSSPPRRKKKPSPSPSPTPAVVISPSPSPPPRSRVPLGRKREEKSRGSEREDERERRGVHAERGSGERVGREGRERVDSSSYRNRSSGDTVKGERGERQERERSERDERGERGGRSERGEKVERGGRAERGERGASRGEYRSQEREREEERGRRSHLDQQEYDEEGRGRGGGGGGGGERDPKREQMSERREPNRIGRGEEGDRKEFARDGGRREPRYQSSQEDRGRSREGGRERDRSGRRGGFSDEEELPPPPPLPLPLPLPPPPPPPSREDNYEKEKRRRVGGSGRERGRREGERGEGMREGEGEGAGMIEHEEASGKDSLVAMETAEKTLEEKEQKKAQPSFALSGKLAEETNKVKGVTLLFTEPPEARKPSTRWRLYVFKDGDVLDEPLYIHRQSCYLFGRERRVVDVPTDHPSCSKQHAVLQYRTVQTEDENFNMKSVVKPYVMDLGSTNGTHLNGERIEPQRYYELLEKDTLKFGNSSREYVILHENSK